MFILKINSVEIAAYPKSEGFVVTTLDLDNAESSTRAADGTLNRDRIAVKRQIDMSWGVLKWAEMSALLQSMAGVYFEFYYPDPEDGVYATRTFYVGNRKSPFIVAEGDEVSWGGLSLTITEQ